MAQPGPERSVVAMTRTRLAEGAGNRLDPRLGKPNAVATIIACVSLFAAGSKRSFPSPCKAIAATGRNQESWAARSLRPTPLFIRTVD